MLESGFRGFAMAAVSVALASIAQLSLKLGMSMWPVASVPAAGLGWLATPGVHLLWLLLGVVLVSWPQKRIQT